MSTTQPERGQPSHSDEPVSSEPTARDIARILAALLCGTLLAIVVERLVLAHFGGDTVPLTRNDRGTLFRQCGLWGTAIGLVWGLLGPVWGRMRLGREGWELLASAAWLTIVAGIFLVRESADRLLVIPLVLISVAVANVSAATLERARQRSPGPFSLLSWGLGLALAGWAWYFPASIVIAIGSAVGAAVGVLVVRRQVPRSSTGWILTAAMVGAMATWRPDISFLAAIVGSLLGVSWGAVATTAWADAENHGYRTRFGLLLAVGAGLVLFGPRIGGLLIAVTAGLWFRIHPSAEELDDAAPLAGRRLRLGILIAAILLALAGRIGFWIATDRVWEDALITIRHAENAVAGHGLTHHPAHGRVHGFTSALSVLIPLAGEMVVAGSAITTLRLASILAGCLTVWFAAKTADHPAIALSTPAYAFWLVYLALDHSQIAFGMAGMETQVWTAVLMGGIAALLYGRLDWLSALLSLALWSRPDGVLWVGAALLGTLTHGWRKTLLVAAGALVGFLPWLIFTTAYYGSPIPNTIRAKQLVHHTHWEIERTYPDFVNYFLDDVASELSYAQIVAGPLFLGQSGAMISTWPGRESLPTEVYLQSAQIYLHGITALLVIGAVCMTTRSAWTIPATVVVFIGYLWVLVRHIHAWYVPPLLALGPLLVGVGLDRCTGWTPPTLRRELRWVLALLLTVVYLQPLGRTFRSERRIQELMEDRVRVPVANWLRDHANPDDFVTAECLGYLSYYSGLPFHDYPGLSSEKSVEVLRTRGADRPDFLFRIRRGETEGYVTPIIEDLRPRWVVLRPYEVGNLPDGYEPVHRVELLPEEKASLREYLPIDDDQYIIFRRREAGERE